jgi:hypothetical protein
MRTSTNYETPQPINLPVVLHDYETWPLTLQEEDGLKVYENRVPWKIIAPNRVGVTGGLRKLQCGGEDTPVQITK